MRVLLALLQDYVARRDRRSQRMLMLCCTAAMALFAGTTVTAAQTGDYPDMTAGAMLLAMFSVVASVLWSARRTAAKAAARRRR